MGKTVTHYLTRGPWPRSLHYKRRLQRLTHYLLPRDGQEEEEGEQTALKLHQSLCLGSRAQRSSVVASKLQNVRWKIGRALFLQRLAGKSSALPRTQPHCKKKHCTQCNSVNSVNAIGLPKNTVMAF